MSLSKKAVKKIVQEITAWANGLSYPLDYLNLQTEWKTQLNTHLANLKIKEELSEKNLNRIKSATIDLYVQINTEAVKGEISKISENLLQKVQNSCDDFSKISDFLRAVSENSDKFIDCILIYYRTMLGQDMDFKYLEKIKDSFENKLANSCKISKPFLYEQIDSIISEEIRKHLESFSKNIGLILQKTSKEQYIETMGFIEITDQNLRKFTISEFEFFPEHWLNFYSTSLKNHISEIWMHEREKEFSLLESNFKTFLSTVLQKLKNQEIKAFDSSICSPVSLQGVCEVVLSFVPEDMEFPCFIIDNFLSLIALPSDFSIEDHLRNKSNLDSSVSKFLENSDQISRFFSIISLVLVFSNTYKYFSKNSISTESAYLPSFRQMIRLIITELFQLNYESIFGYKSKYTEWSLVLLCEQEIASKNSSWVIEDNLISMTEYIKKDYDSKDRNFADKIEDYSNAPSRNKYLKKTLNFTSKIVNSFSSSKRIKEFALEKIKDIDSLSTTIVVSGWLSQEDELEGSWMKITCNELQGHTFALRWDSGSPKKLVKNELFSTVLHSLGVILTAPVIKLAHLALLFSNNPFKKRAKKAETTGYVLADLIASKKLGNACINLVGFSLGTRVIYFCLQRLQELGCKVHDVLLLGGAAPLNQEVWEKCRKVVTGRLVNTYSKTDKILSQLYSISRLEKAIGNWPLDVKDVENYDVTDEASGHLKYRDSLDSVLEKIQYFIK